MGGVSIFIFVPIYFDDLISYIIHCKNQVTNGFISTVEIKLDDVETTLNNHKEEPESTVIILNNITIIYHFICNNLNLSLKVNINQKNIVKDKLRF